MKEFIKKCLVITACVWFLLFCFAPRYQSIDKNTYKMDVTNGQTFFLGEKTWNN